MRPFARSWTPRGALLDGALTARIESIARDWALHWFGPDRRAGAKTREGASLPSAREAPAWTCANDLRISLDPHAPIGLWMLGLSPGAHVLKPKDEDLLAALAGRCARDLIETAQRELLSRSDQALNLTRHEHDRSDLIWSINVGSASNVAYLYISPTVAAEARLRMLPPPPTRRPPVSRQSAIARQRVRVGAMIGRSRMPAGDMRALAVGDVILLDRGPHEPGELSLNGVPCAEDACEIHQVGSQLVLRLAHADAEEKAPPS